MQLGFLQYLLQSLWLFCGLMLLQVLLLWLMPLLEGRYTTPQAMRLHERVRQAVVLQRPPRSLLCHLHLWLWPQLFVLRLIMPRQQALLLSSRLRARRL